LEERIQTHQPWLIQNPKEGWNLKTSSLKKDPKSAQKNPLPRKTKAE